MHLDMGKQGHFRRIAHHATGGRREQDNPRGSGRVHVRLGIDRSTRLACVEGLPDERRGSQCDRSAGLGDAASFPDQITTDTGSCHRSRLCAEAPRWHGIRPIRTRPHAPRTNRTAERSVQALLPAWATAMPYRPSDSGPLETA